MLAKWKKVFLTWNNGEAYQRLVQATAVVPEIIYKNSILQELLWNIDILLKKDC